MSRAEFTAFQRAIFRNCVRFSKQASIHFQCMDWRHIREILDAADGVYTEFKQLITWDKQVGGQGAFYRSQSELIFVFKSGRGRHTNTFIAKPLDPDTMSNSIRSRVLIRSEGAGDARDP